MGLSILDASVLIAFRDADDVHHAAAVKAVVESRGRHALVVPVVAYAEALVGPYRGPKATARAAERFFEIVTRIEPLTPAIARRGAQIRARHGLRLPDALVLATGLELNADEILTADRRWKRIDARVRVITPTRRKPSRSRER